MPSEPCRNATPSVSLAASQQLPLSYMPICTDPSVTKYVRVAIHYILPEAPITETIIASPTEEKNRQMAFYRRAMDEAAYLVVVHELYDTITFSADTLRTWIANMSSIEGDLWLAGERLGIGSSSSAISLLNEAITKYQLTGDKQADIENYKSMVNILSGKPFYSLDATSLQSINGYLESRGYAQGWAKSIATLYGRHFPAEYIKDGKASERSAESEKTSKRLHQTESIIATPNPASGDVRFTISLPNDASEVSIRIFDVNGKQIKYQTGLPPSGSFIWNTESSPSGIYFFHLAADGAICRSGKIILNK